MRTKRVPVMIDADLYQRLKEYSTATDAPVARIVARGLTDWLDKTGRERLDVLMDLTQEN
jgi:ribbon-helix-helix protein